MRKRQTPVGIYLRRWQRRVPGRALLLALVVAVGGIVALRLSLAENTAPELPIAQPPGKTSAQIEAEAARQIIVKYKPDIAQAQADNIAVSAEAIETKAIDQLDMRVLAVPEQQRQQTIDKLNQDPRVEYALPDQIVKARLTQPNDPLYGNQWSLPNMLTDLAWDKTKGSGDVVIAILDTGVTPSHEDMAGGRFTAGYDFVNEDNDPTDDAGHGTIVSGVAAATGNNGIGIAGACWQCHIMPVKVMGGDDGEGLASDTVDGLRYAADHGADIANMSFGGSAEYPAFEDAMKYAESKGVLMVAAAGNEGINTGPDWPSMYDQAISVAGTLPDDSLDPNSNFFPSVDIAAPWYAAGTTREGGYETGIPGTSVSAPMVAGVLGLLKSAFPNATPAQLRDAIVSTADPCCGGKINGGRLNAIKAYNKLAGKLNEDTVKPTVKLTSPAEGATVSGKQVRLAGVASDNVGVVKVHMNVSNGIPAIDTAPDYQFTIDTTGIEDGPYTVTMTAYDAAGNLSSQTHTFTINNTTPDTTSPTASFTSPATNGETVSGTIQVTFSASDANGIAAMNFSTDNVFTSSDVEPPYSYSLDTTKLSNGEHVLGNRVYDSSGNYVDIGRKIIVQNSGTPPPTPPPTTPPPTTPPPGGSPKPADINSSGKVDLTDLSILLSNWNKTTANADLNSSGKVDLTDLSILLSKWNTGG